MKKSNLFQDALEREIQDLLAPYPDPMGRTDFRKACRIGTRTSIYLLQSGLVPCENTGKQTRCYKIAKSDVATYLRRRLAELGTDPRHIYVAIGPSAGPCCYQVDEDTACRFRQVDAATVRPDPAAPGHYLADLWLANRILLLRSGVPAANIATAGLCTICHKAIFYSHRVQGPDRGALVGAVMLR